MEFDDKNQLEDYIYDELGINVTVDKVEETLKIQYGPTIENIVEKKIQALKDGEFGKARVCQEIYSKYCGASKSSGTYSASQEMKLVESTEVALKKLKDELKDISWRSPEEKVKLLKECEDFLSTIDGVRETELIDLSEFKDRTDRLRDEVPKPKEYKKEEKEIDIEENVKQEDPYFGIFDEEEEIDDKTIEEVTSQKYKKQELDEVIKTEKKQEVLNKKEEQIVNKSNRSVKIDVYENMYDKAKSKLKQLLDKIKNAIKEKTQDRDRNDDIDIRR